MKTRWMGLAALLLAAIALGLAAIPSIAFGRPLPWLEEAQRRERAKPTLQVKLRGVVIAIGKEAAPPDPAEDFGLRVVRQCTVAAIGCAAVALVLGPLAWAREREPVVAGSAIAISCVAITWHYVVLGVAVGVGMAVFLVVLTHIAH
jgi:hypothetical protein